MSMRSFVPAAFLLALPQPGAAQLAGNKSSAGCINVSDFHAKVVAEGRLTIGIFSDPYGTERAYILELPESVCIDDGGDFADPGEKFRKVHISATSDAVLKNLRDSVGRKVSVSGEGFAAHTRHHHAPLVVLADKIIVR